MSDWIDECKKKVNKEELKKQREKAVEISNENAICSNFLTITSQLIPVIKIKTEEINKTIGIDIKTTISDKERFVSFLINNSASVKISPTVDSGYVTIHVRDSSKKNRKLEFSEKCSTQDLIENDIDALFEWLVKSNLNQPEEYIPKIKSIVKKKKRITFWAIFIGSLAGIVGFVLGAIFVWMISIFTISPLIIALSDSLTSNDFGNVTNVVAEVGGAISALVVFFITFLMVSDRDDMFKYKYLYVDDGDSMANKKCRYDASGRVIGYEDR